MLLFKLALKNLLGAGTRTWLNVAVTSFSFVLIIFMSGFYQGFLEYAQQVTLETEVAGGAYWHPAYDPDDPFTLDEAHGVPPGPVNSQVAGGQAMPILLTQGSMYPEGRMMPVMIKGIPPDQNIVSLPTAVLGEYTGAAIPVLIGAGMSHTAQLEVGDVFTIRWRDVHGTYDADEAEVVSIMRVENPGVDMGQLWLPLETLREMLEMPGEATYVVAASGAELLADIGDWQAKPVAFFLQQYLDVIEMKSSNAKVLYAVLLAMAALGIFNSQVLSIFRRRKEIGTLMALGMVRSRVVALFTAEGGMHSVLAFVLGGIWGGPLLYFVATMGIPMPYDPSEFGVIMAPRLIGVYGAGMILGTTLLVAVIVTMVSYIPARKIAKLKPTEALTGRSN
ncbi:MAG: ABC transporter permease [Fidelibacterota bacterium]|nr:MAG: ABC transporter permease [Candidatus Neomarinimicrobiota bacterium]